MRRRLGVRPHRSLGWALALGLAAAAVAARLALVAQPPRPDEVGYLLVAAHASPDARFLVGDLWVDRPPLLVAFFALAGAAAPLVGGDPVLAARLLAAALVGVGVLAAGAAGSRLGGRRGGVLAGVVTGALAASPLLGAPAADGEVVAAPLVLVAIAVALRALHPGSPVGHGGSPRGALVLLATSGLLAGAAALVKQNLLDGAVLVVATVLVGATVRTTTWRRSLALLAATALGGLLALGAALAWAQAWGTGPAGVYEALVGFRGASLDVIATHRVAAPTRRALLMTGAAALSVLLPLLALLVASLVRASRRGRLDPVGGGLAAMLAWGVFSVTAGGSYWTHYLVELVPLATLTVAWACRGSRRAATTLTVLTLASCLIATVVVATGATRETLTAPGCRPGPDASAQIASTLRERAAPGDAALVVYGGANVLAGVDVELAYPYLWSLPVRTLDPDLDELTAAVTGPARATWVVRTLPLHSFGLDPDRRLERSLRAGYRQVAVVCGERLLLRRDVVRDGRGAQPSPVAALRGADGTALGPSRAAWLRASTTSPPRSITTPGLRRPGRRAPRTRHGAP